MGSGSSRRKRSGGPGRRGGSSSAPSGPGEEAGSVEPPARTGTPDSRRRPGGEADSDWELLQEVLAECEEPGALPPPPPPRGPVGDSWPGHERGPPGPGAAAAESGPGSGATRGEQPASLTRSTQEPENSFTSEFAVRSNKNPEMPSAISYDYSEEELMASIEREYCR